ncbi:high affinity immunoglobulin gamma Fc receptor I-like [Notolabrus celidotus]|uniref:high affinity immunoglobulin gamma Fc receptor I-like n=1 Tax=Notolabrus celidotus TaxID=1203425 RepID=UPI00148FC310|nr:high affinity immunoglobulin gamma Fc receptor I-like [Notolabrus celidotus]
MSPEPLEFRKSLNRKRKFLNALLYIWLLFSRSLSLHRDTMEVKASCIILWLNVILLIGVVKNCYPQTFDTAHRIVPSKLQLFEYEPISFTCDGLNFLDGWRVRNMKGLLPKCSNDPVTLTVTCTIDCAYEADSGEYWCEGGGRKSNTVNITVTSGLVILESPVLPLTKGDNLTLGCKPRISSANLTAEFYRDGFLVTRSNAGQMTIGDVSKSDEGLYTCEIAHAGMSPGSWLAVRDHHVIMESPTGPVMEGEAVTLRCRKGETSSPSSDHRANFYKDGLFIRSSSTGEMIIHSVSKTDRGLYKCSIYGAGESPESMLSVKVGAHKYDGSYIKTSSKGMNVSELYYILLWLFVIVILVLQLLLVGLLCMKKQLVTTMMNDPNKDLRAAAKRHNAVLAAHSFSVCLASNQSAKPQTEIESGVSSFTVTGLFTSTL